MVLIPIVGASLGIVYAAHQGWLLGVIRAPLVPGYLVGRVLEPVRGSSMTGRDNTRWTSWRWWSGTSVRARSM